MSLASKLKYSIEIWRRATPSTGYQREKADFVKLSNSRCSSTVKNKYERVESGGLVLVSDHVFCMPVVDVTEDDRLKFKGRFYDIYMVKDANMMGKFLHVYALKLPAGAE